MATRINFTKFNRFGPAKPISEKFWEKVVIGSSDECWEWLASLTKDGYGVFRCGLAHRMSWELSFGKIPVGMYVCHRCDNPSCVNPNHLFLGTQFDNMRDMIQKGRINNRQGENNPKAKLSGGDVHDILDLVILGVKRTDIAKEFSVSTTTINYIVSGKTWKTENAS